MIDRYDFEKMGYSSLPAMTDEELEKSKKFICNFLKTHPSSYYMMLNNESRYYTLYTFTDTYLFKTMTDEIIDIVKALGPIKSIETAEDGNALEFWIDYDGIKVFYFFDYAKGVVEI